MAKKVRIVENDIMPKTLHEEVNFNGNKEWILLAFILLLVVLAAVIVPVMLTIIQSLRRHSNDSESG